MREVVDAAVGLRDADEVEHLDGLAAAVALGGPGVVRGVRLGELGADPVEGVQRGEGVLEDHRGGVAADLAQRDSESPTTSWPSMRIEPSMRERFGSCRPSTAIDDTDLPEPDSPTIPRVLPRATP